MAPGLVLLFVHPMYSLPFFVLLRTLEAASGCSSLRTLVWVQSMEGQEREVSSIWPVCSLSFPVVMATAV